MDYIIQLRGISYKLDKDYWKGESVNDSIEFQYKQLQYCIEVGDFITLENRINNMLINKGIIKYTGDKDFTHRHLDDVTSAGWINLPEDDNDFLKIFGDVDNL